MTPAARLPVFARPDGRPAVIVHGGSAPHDYQDVLQALDSALATAADGFELDVRRTADGVLVVHHDETIAGRRPLSDLAYSEASSLTRDAGYPLPLLEHVVKSTLGRLRLDIELKERGYERAVLDALHAYGLSSGDFVVTSFDASTLLALHANGWTETGLLVWDLPGQQALKMFHRSGAAFLAADFKILNDETLACAATAAVPLVAWTVNSVPDIALLINSRAIGGIITDRPDEAMRVRDSLNV